MFGGHGRILALNATSGAVVSDIPVGTTTTQSLAIDAVLNHVYVINSGSSILSVIDGVTNTVKYSIDLGAGLTLNYAGADSSAHRVYVGSSLGGSSPTVKILSDTDDLTPPVITVPSSMTVNTASAGGAAVTYSATALDDVDGSVTTTCSPASGSTFPIGTTTVTCLAQDSRANMSSASFTVTVVLVGGTLTISPTPSHGSITSDTGGINCGTSGGACAASFAGGSVTLSRAADSGYVFGGWTGACAASGLSSTCTLTMNAAATAGAIFNARPTSLVVNSVLDAVDALPGDGLCATSTGVCTLRAAIQEANALSGADTITFSSSLNTTPITLTIAGAGEDGAATAAGAKVTFIVTATDDQDPSVPVTCSPASGSTFALGTTDVACTATDSGGNIGHGTFTVTIANTTGPAFSGVPANMTVDATQPSGGVVTYTKPTATDLVNGAVAVSCSPASGSTFAVGTATVTCSASDARGNTTSASFTVTVRSAAAQLSNLQTQVTGVGSGTSLASKVQSARTALASGDAKQAANVLQALINEAKAQSGKKLTAAQAAAIIDSATRIRGALGY